MISATPASLNLARRLLALEDARGQTSADARNVRSPGHAAPAVRVCEKLRSVLTVFAGASGFRALLARALTLAKLQAPSLAGVHVLEDGELAGFETAGAGANSRSAQGDRTGSQVLVAHLLDLLVIFIGQPLMLRLVRDAWPDVSASAQSSRIEETGT